MALPSVQIYALCTGILLMQYQCSHYRQQLSKDMMDILRREYNFWPFEKYASEKNALNGINRLMQINSSHPIKEGISLIYFIKTSNVYPQRMTYAEKQFRWIYHCCIGFKDLYLDKDFLIDASYYYIVDGYSYNQRKGRLIPKENYLPLSCSGDTFVIPFKNLEYFINLFYPPGMQVKLNEFLNLKERPNLMSIFCPYSESSCFASIQSMIDMSMMLKFDNFTNFFLPSASKEAIDL